MFSIFLFLFFIYFSLGVNTCKEGSVIVKFDNHTRSNEYFIIKGILEGENKERDFFNSLKNKETEICLPKTKFQIGDNIPTYYQYTLECYTVEGIQWSKDSTLEISGEYGNVILHTSYQPTTTFFVLYGITHSDNWYITVSNSSDWLTGNVAGWKYNETSTLSSMQAAYAIYLKKSFEIPSNMAGFEVGLSYRQGIVAYINGVEFYRDNMPDGPIHYEDHATNKRDNDNYSRFTFPASHFPSQSTLYIELHWKDKEDKVMPFEAYLHYIIGNVENKKCFVYPYLPSDRTSLFDLNKSSTEIIGNTMTFDYKFHHAAMINGFRVYHNNDDHVILSQFQVTTESKNGDISILKRNDLLLPANSFHIVTNPLIAKAYYSYRFTLKGSSFDQTIAEIQPLICNLDIVTSIEFAKDLYFFHTVYEEIIVHPLVLDFFNCSIYPSPPEGLSFDSDTCTLSGKMDNVYNRTLFTVTSVMNDNTYNGQFELEVVDCTGTNVEFELSGFEDFNFDYSVEFGPVGGEREQLVFNSDHKQYYCLNEIQYSVKLGSKDISWPPGFLYVYALLSKTEKETLLRANYDLIIGTKPIVEFSLNYIVKPNELWYYRNLTTIADKWYEESPSTWGQATAGNFPSSNQYLQFYQKSFSLTNSAITHSAGIVISLRYQYDFVIYINGKSIFDNGFALTDSSTVNNDLETAEFRQITVPIINPSTHEEIIKTSNTIAIGFKVGDLTTPSFDCVIRLIKERSVSRSFSTKLESNNIFNVFDHHHQHRVSDIDLVTTFENDRHEWITSMSIQLYRGDIPQNNPSLPKTVKLEGRNTGDTDWTVIANKDLTWSLQSQRTHIWLFCEKPYSQFKLSITGSIHDKWNLGYIDFILDAMKLPPQTLNYGMNEFTIFTGIEMGEVYPDFADGYEYCYFYDFQAEKNCLPEGIVIDPNTGVISSTTYIEPKEINCLIEARSFIDRPSKIYSRPLKITVMSCHGGQSLITLVALSDAYPQYARFSIENPMQANKEMLTSSLHMPNNLNYGDFCLPHGYYTLNLKDTQDHGWNNPAGYYITIDEGAMEISTGQVYDASLSHTKKKLTISSAMPFQIKDTVWDLYNGVGSIPGQWNSVDYRLNSDWVQVSHSKFNSTTATTTYVRKEFDKTPGDGVDHVLNVRVQYSGGLLAYVNGYRVARFNLPKEVDSNTLSLKSRDAAEVEKFSKFHVILDTVAFRDKKNVIAFEIHKDIQAPNEYTVTFDASGVFGVKDTVKWNNKDWECSVVVDSYIKSDSRDDIPEDFFTLLPLSKSKNEYYSLKQHYSWKVLNEEGTKFNSFGFQSPYKVDDVSFILRGEKDDYTDLLVVLDVNHLKVSQQSRAFSIDPRGMMSLQKFHFSQKYDLETIRFNTFVPQYCVPVDNYNMCHSEGEFAGVEVGMNSYSDCGYGMEGYAFRTCEENGYRRHFGNVNRTFCAYLCPSNIRYQNSSYTFNIFSAINITKPFYKNIITKFSISPALPWGMTFNEKTGEIFGRAYFYSKKSYSITGENPRCKCDEPFEIQLEILTNFWKYFVIVIIVILCILVLMAIVFVVFYSIVRCVDRDTPLPLNPTKKPKKKLKGKPHHSNSPNQTV